MNISKYFLGLLFATSFAFFSCSKDECKDVVCSNGGACSAGSCVCTSGYEGAKCDTEWRTKFLLSTPTTKPTERCDTQSVDFVYDNYVTITRGTASATEIIITNVGAFGNNHNANLTSATAFNLVSKTVTVGPTTLTITGSGTISGKIITINYTAVKTGVGAGTSTCVMKVTLP